jgi:hypothetical protein
VKSHAHILIFVNLLAALAGTPGLRAAENKYDLLGKTLLPFVQLVATTSSTGNRALTLTLRLESMTDLPEQWNGAHAEIALQYPDKLRLHGPVFGEDLTVCRNGERVWVFPRERAEALFKAAAAQKKLPAPKKKVRLEPFRLPVPEKQLVFLPVLFQVDDVGAEAVDHEACRVLDLRLMPELAKSLDATDWTARVWVRADYRPAKMRIAQHEWSAVVHFDDLHFAKTLPPETWEPSAEQADQVWNLSALQYQQLLKLIGGK